MRILVIEDDQVLHHLISKRLKEEGHSVDDCYDGNLDLIMQIPCSMIALFWI